MATDAWDSKTAGSLTFRYQPDTTAAQRIDEIAAEYERALGLALSFLGQPSTAAPELTIYLCEFLPPLDGQPEMALTRREPERGELWTTVNAESPGADPAVELTQLLLHRSYGPVDMVRRFWYDGAAGYVARLAGSTFHAEAGERVQKLYDAGQLPPLPDLLQIYGMRQSGTGMSTATAFVGFLIDQYAAERYRRLLAGLSEGTLAAVRRAYRTPLQSLEQVWYRTLEEAAAASGGASLLVAIKKLVPFMHPYRFTLLAILGCILVTIAFTIFLPLAIRFLVNNILARAPLPFDLFSIGSRGERLQPGDEQLHALATLLGAMVVMFVLFAFSNMKRSYMVTTMGESVSYDLRKAFFERLQQVPIAYHRRTPNQDLIQRFWTDIGTIQMALTFGIVPMAQSLLAMLLFGAVLISLNWKLSLVALAGLPIFAYSFQRSRAKMRDAARERTRRQTDVGISLVETLNTPEKIRDLDAKGYLTQRLLDRLGLLRDIVIRITEMASASASTSQLITNGAQVLVLVIGGVIVIESNARDLTTGDLMAFYVLLLQLYAPAGLFTASMQYVNQATTSLDRVNGVLTQPIVQDPPEAVEIGPLREAIRLEQVSVSRARGKDAIKSLSLETPAGRRVAFVGPPGAGKASLMELIPHYFDPDEGSITWDGVDLRTASSQSLRRNLAVVSQETYVFNATIYDNIRYGRIDASFEEVEQAARLAGLHDFIVALPGGYDQQVNDRDSTFGLVQRQRLSVARALLQSASVVLMDDALTALDTPSQRELEDALRGPSHDRTLIRIAQRVGSVREADLIYVLDGGELVQQGRDDELAGVDGLYAQLLRDELGAGAVSGAFQAARRLARQEPFKQLDADAVEEMARLMLYTERGPDEVVCRQGSVGDELFFLGKGDVDIVLEEGDGQERAVTSLHEGDFFGEISFLLQIPRTATVRARTNVELHILRRQDFDALLERRGLTQITEHLKRTADERLAANRAFAGAPR